LIIIFDALFYVIALVYMLYFI